MFSKLSVVVVSAAAVLGVVIAVHGQDESRPSAPWPFGRSFNLLRLGNDGNSNANGNTAANGNAGSPSADGSANSNSSAPQATHSVTAQSQANRRLYGPSLAVRAGVADGYAQPQPNTPNQRAAAPRPSAGDMKPVISQGTAASSGSAGDASSYNSTVDAPPARVSAAEAVLSRSSNSNSALSPGVKSDESSARDSRSLPERLAAIRRASEKDQSLPVAAEIAGSPDVAPLKTGPSSRRVIAPSLDSEENLASERLAAPNKAASIDAPSRTNPMPDSVPDSDAVKPRAVKQDAVKPDGLAAAKGQPSRESTPDKVSPESSSGSGGTASGGTAAIGTASSGTAPGVAASSGSLLFTRQSPLVSVETSGPRTIVIGKEAAYLLTIKNSGDVGAQDLSVTVRIPDWTDVAGAQATAGTARVAAADNNEPFQWKLPRLEAHGKETLTLRLLPRKGRPFDLAVQWTFLPIATQTMVDVQEPKLNMTIAGPDEVIFGQSKLYRLTISNPGTGDADNVVVALDPIGNSSAPASKHPIGTIHAGDSKVVELELTARQSGTLSIHAEANAEPGLKAEAAQEVLVRRAAVALAIEGAKAKYAGTLASYSIKVSNPGNATAENVRIFAALPPGAKFVAASAGGQWKAEQSKVVWSLPALRTGGETALDLKCTLVSPGQNRLQITSSAAGDVSDVANITTNVEALADLKLDVSQPAGPIAVGDEVVYELRVHNRGSKAAEGIGVVAYFSEGIEPVSAQGGGHDIANGVVAFHALPTLTAGGDATFKIKARADRAGKQVFRAEVECGTLGTKLVNAEEMMVYGGEETPGLEHADRSVAGRNPPLQPVPNRSEDGSAKPFRR